MKKEKKQIEGHLKEKEIKKRRREWHYSLVRWQRQHPSSSDTERTASLNFFQFIGGGSQLGVRDDRVHFGLISSQKDTQKHLNWVISSGIPLQLTNCFKSEARNWIGVLPWHAHPTIWEVRYESEKIIWNKPLTWGSTENQRGLQHWVLLSVERLCSCI